MKKILFIIFLLYIINSQTYTQNYLRGPYIDSTYFTKVPFGSDSHWLQAWRGYMETVPINFLLKGVGICIKGKSGNPDMMCQMMAKNGFSITRFGIPWRAVKLDETAIDKPDGWIEILRSCKKWGIRPIITLSADDANPCPGYSFSANLVKPVTIGDTLIELIDTTGIITGYTGLFEIKDGSARRGYPLIKAINGNIITMSAPVSKNYTGSIELNVLKYKPFSKPGTTDYLATMLGWTRYVRLVAEFVAIQLQTTGQSDLGFDMEIWNELSNSSNFLNINDYYSKPIVDIKGTEVFNVTNGYESIVHYTADMINNNKALFAGVKISDGFGNTSPFPASSREPSVIKAIGSHPYPKYRVYPQDEYKAKNINALGVRDSSFVPSYVQLFPEFAATWVQSESILRDAGPINNKVGDNFHGRYARPGNPCYGWFTECGISPLGRGVTDTTRALYLKAKIMLRYYTFYMNKGIEKITAFATDDNGGDIGFDMMLEKFQIYSKNNATYPVNDADYTSPIIKACGNMFSKMRLNMDTNLTSTRPLQVISISDNHNHLQFAGNNTDAFPNMYNRECLAILPYQVNNSKFVIPYYVITRNILVDLPEEQYVVTIKGIKAKNAQIEVYDPLENIIVPHIVNSAKSDTLTLTLKAKDYPYLLIVEEELISEQEEKTREQFIRIYPNPSSFEFNFLNVSNNEFKYILRNVMGQIVETGIVNGSHSFGKNVPNGNYIIEIISGNQVNHIKIIKK